MIHWLAQGFSTYVLHSQHGNGYQFGSGGPGPLWIAQLGAWITIAWQMARRHNCYERRCLKVGTHRSQLDHHVRCRADHERHKATTAYIDAKQP